MELLASRILLHPIDLHRRLRFYEQTVGLAIYREWGTRASGGAASSSAVAACSKSRGGVPSRPLRRSSWCYTCATWARPARASPSAASRWRAQPELKPWGLLEMTACDPDGLALIFVEVPPDHPRRHG